MYGLVLFERRLISLKGSFTGFCMGVGFRAYGFWEFSWLAFFRDGAGFDEVRRCCGGGLGHLVSRPGFIMRVGLDPAHLERVFVALS